MIEILLKNPAYKSFRTFGYPKMMPLSLTINATYNCNSRCNTCRIWKKKANELTIEEWENIFKKIGPDKIYWLIISGGEPFLRKDLVQICSLANKYLKPKIINIPTNGYLFEIISRSVEKILSVCPRSQIVINFSLDEVGEKHDKIRNFPGSFENLAKSYSGLRKIKNPRLSIGMHTVISKFNEDNIPFIYDYVEKEFNPDVYIAEIAEKRFELDNIDLEIAPEEKKFLNIIDFLLRKMNEKKVKGFPAITQTLRKNYYALAKKIISEEKQVIPCFAGFVSAQISAGGEVWPCCVRGESMGNLRENNYDFRKIWKSQKADLIRKSIKRKECFCPLASASYTNMIMDLKEDIKIMFKYLVA